MAKVLDTVALNSITSHPLTFRIWGTTDKGYGKYFHLIKKINWYADIIDNKEQEPIDIVSGSLVEVTNHDTYTQYCLEESTYKKLFPEKLCLRDEEKSDVLWICDPFILSENTLK